MILLLACTGATPVDSDPPVDTDVVDTDTTTDTEDTGVDCYTDADLDGYGDRTDPAPCRSPAVADSSDCNDEDDRVFPGAPEVCNTYDDDCDGLVDDADADLADGLPFYVDTDGDGFGSTDVVTACTLGELTLVGGDCDDADPAVSPDADEACDGVDRNCDGVAPTSQGSGASCPATRCLDILAEEPTSPDGAYWIQAPGGDVAEVWCDMTTDGGGWTLGFLRNTASTASQGDFGYGDEAIDGLGNSLVAASTSAAPLMSWLDLNDVEWDELQLAAAYSGVETYRSRIIPRTDLRVAFGDDGYYLHGESGYYWCGGSAAYTDAGVGAVNNPPGAPPDCKWHGSLGSGWDFSESPYGNAGLTLCGGDASYFLAGSWGGSWTYYNTVGAAQAIWVR